MANPLSNLKTFWTGNSTLNTALSSSKLFLDFVPPTVGVSYPYGAITVISEVPTYFTSGTHIEDFHFQIILFNTDFEALNNLADTVEGVLDQSYPTAATALLSKQNRIPSCHIDNDSYTYQIVLEYNWSYNSSLA